MQLSEIRAAVSLRTGIGASDSAYTYIDDRINEANHVIETYAGGQWDHLWTEVEDTTDANVEYVTFAALATAGGLDVGIRRVTGVEYQASGSSAWVPLERANLRTARSYYVGMTSGTDLGNYVVRGQRVYFFPTPSAALAIRVGCYQIEPELSDDADVPLLPATYHRVLVAMAAGLVLRSTQRHGEAAVEEASAKSGLDQMLAAQDPSTGPGRPVHRIG